MGTFLARIVRSRWLLAMRRWVDGYAGPGEADEADRDRIDWFRILPFLSLHVLCLGVLWVGWSPMAVAVAVGLYVVRMLAITGGYHRYFCHRSFRTSRVVQFALAVVGNAAAQRGPLWWAGHHRHHHRFTDQPGDVHSPKLRGFWWSHVLWLTTKGNFRTRQEYVKDLARYPELVFLDRFSMLVPLLLAAGTWLLGWTLATWAPWLGTDGPQMFIWGFVISTVALYHGTFTINSLAHMIGRQPYDTGDTSRNSWLLAIITFGEGWHNNHHRYPSSARQGFRWWQFDPTWWLLSLGRALGLVWNLRPLPASVVAEGDRPARTPGRDGERPI